MAKKGKKRRHDETTTIAVASLTTRTNEDSIESCLAEMAGAASLSTESTAPPVEFTSSAAEAASSNELLCDPSLASLPLSTEMRERIIAWNRSMRTWQTTGTYTPGMLPSFDVELSRHFKVQALSTFLLDACKDLKMPAFERW